MHNENRFIKCIRALKLHTFTKLQIYSENTWSSNPNWLCVVVMREHRRRLSQSRGVDWLIEWLVIKWTLNTAGYVEMWRN